MPICKTCKIDQPQADFYKSDRTLSGYRGTCKACGSVRTKAHYRENYVGRPGQTRRVQLPDVEVLRKAFERREDGVLVRTVSSGNCRAGQVVGSLMEPSGYYRVWIAGVHAMAHRIVWKIVTGEEPGEWLDHVDGDRSNNHFSNLREVSAAQNSHNQGYRVNNTSGFIGVRWYNYSGTAKWCAYLGGKHVGYFEDLGDAIRAFNTEAAAVQGEYAARKIAHNREMAAVFGLVV